MSYQLVYMPPTTASQRRQEPSFDLGREAGAFGLGAADGLTFGFSDELYGLGAGAGAALSGRDFGKARDEATWQARNALTDAQRDHGGAAFAGQLFGGFALGGGVGAAAKAGLRGVSTAALGPMTRVGAAALTGAAGGGLYGYGSGIDDNDRLKLGIEGGIWGAALGGAGQAVLGEAVPTIARNMWQGASPRAAATNVMGDTFRRAGLNEAALRTKLQEVAAQSPRAMVLDALEDQGAMLAQGARLGPSEGRDVLERALRARETGFAQDTIDDLSGLAGVQRASISDDVNEYIATRKRDAAPLYARAYAGPAVSPTPAMQETILRNPDLFQPAVANAQKWWLSKTGEAAPDITNREYWARVLEYADDELGRRIKQGFKGEAEGFSSSRSPQYVQALQSFNREVSNLLGDDFKAAQAIYSTNSRMIEAAQRARSVLSANPNELAVNDTMAFMRRLRPPEQEAFRRAVLAEMVSKIDNATRLGDDPMNPLRDLMKTEGQRRVLERVFGGSKSFERVLEQIGARQRMMVTGARTGLNVNSLTAPSAAMRDAIQARTGSPATTPGGIFSRLLDPIARQQRALRDEQVSDEIMRVLATPAQQALADLNRATAGRGPVGSGVGALRRGLTEAERLANYRRQAMAGALGGAVAINAGF